MPATLLSRTSLTLLERVACSGVLDQLAWAEFVERYGRKVYLWCLHWGLQEADAQDVTQTVLLKLLVRMKEFRYDPSRSFRAWLKTVARRAWQDFVDRQRLRRPSPSGTASWAMLETIEAEEDLTRRLEEQFERELLEQAMQSVQPRVAPCNWQAFCLTTLEGMPAAEAARRLNMKIARVYAARSSIGQLLQEECRRLEEQHESL